MKTGGFNGFALLGEVFGPKWGGRVGGRVG